MALGQMERLRLFLAKSLVNDKLAVARPLLPGFPTDPFPPRNGSKNLNDRTIFPPGHRRGRPFKSSLVNCGPLAAPLV